MHQRWHRSHPGFACRICYFKFGDIEALVSHKKLHENRPNEECVFCGKMSKNIKAFRAHMEIHDVSSQYKVRLFIVNHY